MDSAPPRHGRALVLLALSVLFGITLWAFAGVLLDTYARPPLQRAIERAAGFPISFGRLSAGFLGDVVFHDVVLAAPVHREWEIRLRAPKVSLDFHLRDLLFKRRSLEGALEGIRLVAPEMTLARRVVPIPSGSGTTPLSSALSLPPAPVEIRRGVLFWKPDPGASPIGIASEFHFDARPAPAEENGSSPAACRWSVDLETAPPEGKGMLRVVGAFQPENVELSGRVFLDRWPLVHPAAPRLFHVPGRIAGGTLSARGSFHWRPEKAAEWNVEGSLMGVRWIPEGRSGPAVENLTGAFRADPRQLRLDRDGAGFTFLGAPWTLKGSVGLRRRTLDFQAATDRLPAAGLASLVRLGGREPSEGFGLVRARFEGTWDAPRAALESEFGAFQVGPWRFRDLRMEARYLDGLFQVHRFEGRTEGGEVAGTAGLDLRGSGSPEVRLDLVLKGLETGALFSTLGLPSERGRTDLRVRASGTLRDPRLDAEGRIEIEGPGGRRRDRTVLEPRVRLGGGRLEVSLEVDGRDRWEAMLREEGDFWRVERAGQARKSHFGRWTVEGTVPKAAEGPLEVRMKAQRIRLEGLPYLRRFLPGMAGEVDLNASLGGTRAEPKVSLELASRTLTLEGGVALPFQAKVRIAEKSAAVEELSYGNMLAASGTLGLGPAEPHDLRLSGNGIPLSLLAGLAGWTTAPTPFGGILKGEVRLRGNRRVPLLEGEAVVEGPAFGEWRADRLHLVLKPDAGATAVETLEITSNGSVSRFTGRLEPEGERMRSRLRLEADRLPVRKEWRLTGSLEWEGSHDGGWRDLRGVLTGRDLSLADGTSPSLLLPSLRMKMALRRGVFTAEGTLGKAVSVSFLTDSTGPARVAEGSLLILETPFSDLPQLRSFLAKEIPVRGLVSGRLSLERAEWGEFPLRGDFQVREGSVGDYAFDRLGIRFTGTSRRLEPVVTLEKGSAHWKLSGRVESTRAFWDAGAAVALDGPFRSEPLATFLPLLGLTPGDRRVEGTVDGNVGVRGTVGNPRLEISLRGEDLRWGSARIPSARLRFLLGEEGVRFEESRVVLLRGELGIASGVLRLGGREDPRPEADLKLFVRGVPLGPLQLTSRLSVAGRFSATGEGGHPLFEGTLGAWEGDEPEPPEGTLWTEVAVGSGAVTFRPARRTGPRLSGSVDFSRKDRWIFRDFQAHLAPGSLEAEGVLDLAGPSRLSVDASRFPLGKLSRWFGRRPPLEGEGTLHLVLEGGPEEPLLNASFSVAGGRIGALPFDLLDGQFSSRSGRLTLGSREVPLRLSRKGVYALHAWGSLPFALTAKGRQKLRDREIDVRAEMPEGDLSLLLLTGFFKEASGDLAFSLQVSGTLDDPVVTADLEAREGRLVPPLIAKSLEDLNGRVKVRDNRVVVEDLNARIGQGRVFLWTPPAEESRMELEGFSLAEFDLRVRTVTERGVLLNIPAIMRPGEYGEIHFHGSRREDPLLIVGPLQGPRVVGTVLLDTGRYTFPPIEAKSASGEKITYKELAGVIFELKLQSGRDCWYSNEFNTSYLELKVNPGEHILIEGRDADSTPRRAGIQSRGSVEAREGFLRYLGREFQLDYAKLFIPKGEVPVMRGRATDLIRDAEIRTPAGTRRTDVEVWVEFEGPFGNVDFRMDSNPRFATSDDDTNQKLLLSYLLFGRDMTGQARQDLEEAYRQKVGAAAGDAVVEALDRIASAQLTRQIRPLARQFGDLDVNIKSNVLKGTTRRDGDEGAIPSLGEEGLRQDAEGNTLPGVTPLAEIELRKHLDPRLAVVGRLGLGQEEETGRTTLQNRVGLEYWVNRDLSLNTMVGENPEGISEKRVGFQFRKDLPNVKRPRKDDREPPRVERFEVHSLGSGKARVFWETDEVTSAEILLLEGGGDLVRRIPGPGGYEYWGEAVVEGLDPEQEFVFQVVVTDLNGNRTTSRAVPLDASP